MFQFVRKKIVSPLRLIAVAILLLFFSFHFAEMNGTLAVITDAEKSERNLFQAGEWGTPPVVPPVKLDYLVITEVLYDPDGTDTGLEWIELYNGTSGSIDMSGMELNATSGDYFIFPAGFTLNQYSFVVVHWRADGTNNSTNLYTGEIGYDANMGDSKGWVALFNNSTHSKDTIVDYIEYGEGDQTWENDAVEAGIWTEDNFVPDVSEGHSIEKKEKDADIDLASEFKNQATPTPGS